jgi:pyrrolysine biosynthesis protein PylD
VALRTIGVIEEKNTPLSSLRVAVIPMTTGGGVIPGFSEAVAAIAAHIGLDAGVTRSPDVSGIAEAYAAGSDIVVMADDVRFVAINTRSGLVTENDRATGEGFAALLDMMVGGVRGRRCGVIGCGPVGAHAAKRLAGMGAELTLCDFDERRGRQLIVRLREHNHMRAVWVKNAGDLLKRCPFIVDATPCSDIISADAIRADTVITVPGVPVGLTSAALDRIGLRCYHDNLPLGVATMLLAAVYGRMTEGAKP